MGFVKDALSGTVVGGALGIESSAEEAARKAAGIQSDAGLAASAAYNPLLAASQSGVDNAGFLTDSTAQFDYLQSNPFFGMIQDQNQFATNQAQDALFKSAAAKGRLTAGDTLQQVQDLGTNSANNLMLSAYPLIEGQKSSIAGMIDLNNSILGNQGNLQTGAAAAEAGGVVGAANAKAQNQQNVMDIASLFGGGF